jgi:hypothetical protein
VLIDKVEGVWGLVCGDFLGLGVGDGYGFVFGGYGCFWVKS